MARTFTRTFCFDRDGDFEVTVEFTATPFIPAQTYGLPEDCSPAEGGEIEILSVRPLPDDKPGIEDIKLTEAEESRLIDYLSERLSDEDFDYDHDW